MSRNCSSIMALDPNSILKIQFNSQWMLSLSRTERWSGSIFWFLRHTSTNQLVPRPGQKIYFIETRISGALCDPSIWTIADASEKVKLNKRWCNCTTKCFCEQIVCQQSFKMSSLNFTVLLVRVSDQSNSESSYQLAHLAMLQIFSNLC